MGCSGILCLFFVISANVWGTLCITRGGFVHNPYHHNEEASASSSRNFRRHIGATTSPSDWEVGLREAVNQALLRERFNDPNLKEQLFAAPFIGKEDSATPFGDVAVLARGQVYSTHDGYRFVQDLHQSECEECHAGRRRCHIYQCQLYKPQQHGDLVALWSVKRIRHRDAQYGHRYELEYTVSPMNQVIHNQGITEQRRFNYDIPGHVFVVKRNPQNSVAFQQSVSRQGGKWYPNPSKVFVLNGPANHRINFNDAKDDYRPGNGFTQNSFVQANPQIYLPPNHYPQEQQPNGIDPREIELYKQLVDSLSAKTTSVSQHQNFTTALGPTYIRPVPTVPIDFTRPIYHHEATGSTGGQTSTKHTTSGFLVPTTALGGHTTEVKQEPIYTIFTPIEPPSQAKPETTQYHRPSTPVYTRPTVVQTTSTKQQTPTHSTTYTSEIPRPPIEAPITTVHYFMPVSEHMMTSDREAHTKETSKTTSIQKPYTKKPYFTRKTTQKTTKYTKPTEAEYSEEFDLFPDTGPTEPMKPITQKPLLKPPTDATTNQLQPPNYTTKTTPSYVTSATTQRTTSSVPPFTKEVTRKMSTTQSKSPRITTTTTTRQSTTSRITIPETFKTTTQDRNARPSTIFEYSFDSTTRPSPTEPKSSHTTIEFKSTAPTDQKTTQDTIRTSRFETTINSQPIKTTLPNFYTSKYKSEASTPPTQRISSRPETNRPQTITDNESFTQTRVTSPYTYRTSPRPNFGERTTNNLQTTTTYQDTTRHTLHPSQQYTTGPLYQSTPPGTQGFTIIRTPTEPNFVTNGGTVTYLHPVTLPQTTSQQPTFVTYQQPVTLYQKTTAENHSPLSTVFQLPTTIYSHPTTLFTYPSMVFGQTTNPGVTTFPTGTTTPILIALHPQDTIFTTAAKPTPTTTATIPPRRTTKYGQQTTSTKIVPVPVPSNDFLADKEHGSKGTSINLQSPGDYSEDDIFGANIRTTSKTTRKTMPKHYTQSDIETALFGTIPTEEQNQIAGPTNLTPVTPKIIFSNFFQASTAPVTTPTPYILNIPQETLYTVDHRDTTTIRNHNIVPVTQQSYSTSISFQVNKRNATLGATEPISHVEFEPSIKAELQEIPNHKGNYKIYKAELPEDNYIETTAKTTTKHKEEGDPKAKFDMVALQLINHARSIDYLNNRNKTTEEENVTVKNKIPKEQQRQPKYKRRRNYVPKSKRGQRRHNTRNN